MTDFSRLVRGRMLDPRRAEAAGFRKKGAEYVLRRPLSDLGLLAEITLGEKTLGIRVLEEDGEEFYLLRVGNAAGSFLPAVRDAEEAGKNGLVNWDLFIREIQTGIYARNTGAPRSAP